MLDMDISLRRAIERLRDGLFDSVAVNRLTMKEEHVIKKFSEGLTALAKGRSEPLCICGSYGQGKSHTLTYLNNLALSQGFATSFVQLDLREIPFHRFSLIYHSIMEKLSLPDGEDFVIAWKKWGENHSLELFETIPYRFQMILTAMLCKKKPLMQMKKSQKKNKDDQSTNFSHWLEKALKGNDLPIAHLKNILKSLDIEGYQKQSLICRGNLPYVQMIQAFGKVLKEMGYKGLLLFFDEAESITQGRLGNRVKSYEILNQFFQSKNYIYPIFALTDDFFDQVKHEQYEDEKQSFSCNYAEAWKNLNIVRLKESSSDNWKELQNRLIQLYSEAYQIDFSNIIAIRERLENLLEKIVSQETRFKLKALVNQLDIETQRDL